MIFKEGEAGYSKQGNTGIGFAIAYFTKNWLYSFYTINRYSRL